MPNVHVSTACQSDIGLVRGNNEDAFLVTDFHSQLGDDGTKGCSRLEVGPRGVLLVVSDGMGGENAGEVASALVVKEVAQCLERATPEGKGDDLLKEAVARAHSAVAIAAKHTEYSGMGATLTAIHIKDDFAYVAEVGDSRAYLIRCGVILPLTKDQNLAQLMVDAGSLAAEEVGSSFMSNVLAQSMGHNSSVQPALGKLALRDRDCLLLCSDGLTKAVTDREIVDTVLGSKTLEQACASLVNLANERGGDDNVTVVIAGIAGDLPQARIGDRPSGSYEILETFSPRLQSPPRGKSGPLVPAEVKVVR
jgi:serine/threonine protein phosphatase PrpC